MTTGGKKANLTIISLIWSWPVTFLMHDKWLDDDSILPYCPVRIVGHTLALHAICLFETLITHHGHDGNTFKTIVCGNDGTAQDPKGVLAISMTLHDEDVRRLIVRGNEATVHNGKVVQSDCNTCHDDDAWGATVHCMEETAHEAGVLLHQTELTVHDSTAKRR